MQISSFWDTILSLICKRKLKMYFFFCVFRFWGMCVSSIYVFRVSRTLIFVRSYLQQPSYIYTHSRRDIQLFLWIMIKFNSNWLILCHVVFGSLVTSGKMLLLCFGLSEEPNILWGGHFYTYICVSTCRTHRTFIIYMYIYMYVTMFSILL